jgi:glycerol uptake facilitator-like aquaporin
MAHFNPAVTVGFMITKHITKIELVYYFAAETLGALLGSLFVKYTIGTQANLGANAPNYAFPILAIFLVEVLASALLMAVILAVVYTKGLRGFSGIAIGGIVGLDIFFLSFISGASMNPARSLAPALLSGIIGDLWLYPTILFYNQYRTMSISHHPAGYTTNQYPCKACFPSRTYYDKIDIFFFSVIHYSGSSISGMWRHQYFGL